MRTVAILANHQKPTACAVEGQLTERLQAAGMHVIHQVTGHGVDTDFDALIHAEMAFVLGGDGTLLGVARHLALRSIPLLGINVGHLGFLSEASPETMDEAVRRVSLKDYELESRLMLEAQVWRGDKCVSGLVGLNDAGIAKASFARMVTVDVFVDDVYVDTYSGDGVLISTPTGSTAYSLSCGGPICVPHLQVMLLTPICPHTLSSRPCVIDANQEIRITVHSHHLDVGLTVDGQVGVKLEPGDEVRIHKSPYPTTLVKWRTRDFFTVLRQKLHGVDSNRPLGGNSDAG